MATVGSLVTFSVVFASSTGVATDPTVIHFWLREGVDGTELEWTYNVSPVSGVDYPVGMNALVRDSAGNFHLDWVIRKPERQTGVWQGTGTVTQTSQTTVLARHSGVSAVEVY